MATLDLTDKNFAVELLSYYLWGKPKKDAPTKSNIADEQWINRSGGIKLDIDVSTFLEKAGEFVNVKDFKLFETFFSGETKDGNKLDISNIGNAQLIDGKYYLTQQEFADLFYKDKDGEPIMDSKNNNLHAVASKPTVKDNPTSITLYNRNSTNPNFAKLAFAFGSIKVGLNTDKIRYVLDENLNPIRVENIEYEFDLGDFDFKSNSGTANLANQILEPILDPSGIGQTVDFKIIGGNAKVSGGDISKFEYLTTPILDNVTTDMKEMLVKLGLEGFSSIIGSLSAEAILYLLELDNIVSSGIVDYLDENNKLVIFGSNDKDPISGTKAKNFDFSQGLEVYLKDLFGKFDINIPISPLLLNHYNKYKNGIHYIGGDGDDTITGTNKNDIVTASVGKANRIYTLAGDDTITLTSGSNYKFINLNLLVAWIF